MNIKIHVKKKKISCTIDRKYKRKLINKFNQVEKLQRNNL